MVHFTNSLEVYATTITCIQHSIKWCVHYKEMKKVRFEQQTQLGANQLFLHAEITRQGWKVNPSQIPKSKGLESGSLCGAHGRVDI